MKRFLIATTALTLLVAPMSGAFAQNWNSNRHDDNRPGNTMTQGRDDHRDNFRDNNYRDNNNGRHDWRRGGRIGRDDWNRGERVNDYHRYHLSRPPRGYEWRRVDNNYILAAAATGLIAGLVLANH